MEAWLGLIGAILGAVLGWGLSEISRAVFSRRQNLQNVGSAALSCLDRLLKVQRANESHDKEQTDREIWHLGGDLDRYRDAIASSSQRREAHWQLYKETLPLLQHDLGSLDQLIKGYELESGFSSDQLSNMSVQPTARG